MLEENDLIISLYKINYPGPYVLKIFNDVKNKFQIFGEIFMVSEDLKFYNKDGTGPWDESEVAELQSIINQINSDKDKTSIKAYFEYFTRNEETPYHLV